MLPQMVVPLLRHQFELVRRIHEDDLRAGFGSVWLPEAIERKIPTAATSWDGKGYSRPPPARKSPPACNAAITSTKVSCSARSNKRLVPRQAHHLPHLPPLLRHPPPGARPRHPHSPGAPWTPRHHHYHDLHPRSPLRCPRRPQPARRDVTCRATRPRDGTSRAIRPESGKTSLRATRHRSGRNVPRYASRETRNVPLLWEGCELRRRSRSKHDSRVTALRVCCGLHGQGDVVVGRTQRGRLSATALARRDELVHDRWSGCRHAH